MSAARATVTGNKFQKSTKTKHSPKKGQQIQTNIDTFVTRKRKGEEDCDQSEKRNHKSSRPTEIPSEETEIAQFGDIPTFTMTSDQPTPKDSPMISPTGTDQLSQVQSMFAQALATSQAENRTIIEATVKSAIEETVKCTIEASVQNLKKDLETSFSAQLGSFGQDLQLQNSKIGEVVQRLNDLETKWEESKMSGGGDPEEIKSLKRTILQLQIDARAKNVVLYGLEEKQMETSGQLSRKIAEILTTHFGRNNFSFDPPSRISSKSRPRPVLICFHQKQQRDTILYNKRVGFPYRIGSDMPPEVAKMRESFNAMVAWANQNRVPYKRTDTFVTMDGKKYNCDQAKKFLKDNNVNPTKLHRGAPRDPTNPFVPSRNRGTTPPATDKVHFPPHGRPDPPKSAPEDHERQYLSGNHYGRNSFSEGNFNRFNSSQNNFSQNNFAQNNFSQNNFPLGNPGRSNFSRNNSYFDRSNDHSNSEMEA